MNAFINSYFTKFCPYFAIVKSIALRWSSLVPLFFLRHFYSVIFIIFINTYSFAAIASDVASDPKLEIMGAATYGALGKDYYIASLHVTDPSKDALTLLADNTHQKMMIKVIAKRWSSRKWKAQWQDNIVINNGVNTDADLAKAIVEFTEFPLGSLKAADEVIIEYVPGKGTRVYFNTHEMIRTDDAKLYFYLVNTWLGKFSLNRDFRAKITGSSAPEYELLAIINETFILTPARINEVDGWFISEEEKIRAERQQALLIAEAINKQQQQEVEKRKAEEQKKLNDIAQQKELLFAKQKEAEDNKSKEAERRSRGSLQYQMALQDYYQQLYLWQLQTHVNESVVYPESMDAISEKSSVRISFATDRNGSLLNFVNKTPGTSNIFIQEVVNRILVALKTSQRPPGIEGNRWSFTITYVFDPLLEKPRPLTKPQEP